MSDLPNPRPGDTCQDQSMKITKVTRRRRAKFLTKKFWNSRVSYKATVLYFVAAIVVGLFLRYYFPVWS